MKKNILACMIVLAMSTYRMHAQNAPFNIQLEPVTINGLGGLQSFAFAQHNGKWLIVGGRLDGLHRRQPFAAFDIAGHNNQLVVIDPVAMQKWSAPLTVLPLGIQEQLSSTNMNFFQQGDYLYCTGGYGYSASQAAHTTYPNLTAIKVSDVIDAIISGLTYSNYFRQITDTAFQVTGGRLEKINSTFYLVGGHKFIGSYNPMGPNHGPGFFQQYTNQIRKFNLSDNGVTITISHLPSITDTNNLHRRDYNVTAQILPNGAEGLTAFSGVFQKTVNLPFLNCVNIDSTAHTVNNAFTQYYNHYHCANFPIYSAANNEMNTIFFGGIAQYYDSLGLLTQNNDVPFVKTIARVTRNANGVMAEYKLPVEMPSYLGAGSEFIPNENLPRYPNGVIKFDDVLTDTTLVGYIYGGIASSAQSIFWINTGTQSSASNQIFKVFLIKNSSSAFHEFNMQSIGSLQMQVFTEQDQKDLIVKYKLAKQADVTLNITTIDGKVVEQKTYKNMPAGEHTIATLVKQANSGGTFLVTIATQYEKATQQIILR